MGFEDTFKRQIDETGKVLIRLLTGLLGLKQLEKYEDSVFLVKKTLTEKAFLDFDEIISMPPGQLAEYLSEKKKMNNHNIDKIAEVFYEIGDAAGISGGDSAQKYFRISLALHEYLNVADSTYSFERQNKIEELKEILEDGSG